LIKYLVDIQCFKH